jgi:hypothetical protein
MSPHLRAYSRRLPLPLPPHHLGVTSMARPSSGRRHPPPSIPVPRAPTSPRPGSSASRSRARRVRVHSPSLAAARGGAAPHPPPPPPPPETPLVRWPLYAGDAGSRSSHAGEGAGPSVRKIAAALWRMQPPQAPPAGPRRPRRTAEVSLTRDLCESAFFRVQIIVFLGF